MTEPLPCPFCGGPSVSVSDGSTFRWRVAACNTCGAQCGEIRAQTLGEGTPQEWEAEAREEAIAEWNTRVQT
jgi:Lar family restriction alleviation protein